MSKRDEGEAAAPKDAVDNDGNSPPKKLKTHHSNKEELTPEEIAYRRKVESQLQEGEHIGYMPLSALKPRPELEAKMEKAVLRAIQGVEEQLKKGDETKKNNYEYSDEDSESDQSYIGKRPDSRTLSTMQKNFFKALKDFTLMRLGFDAGDEKKLCRCPCGRQAAKWRHQNGLEDLIESEESGCSHSQFYTPSGLMDHLKQKGGMRQTKEHGTTNHIGMICPYHYGARLFLEETYERTK